MIFYYSAFCIVHPEGIPSVPSVQSVISDALVNVPVCATPYNQPAVHLSALIFVAKHVIEFNNIQL